MTNYGKRPKNKPPAPPAPPPKKPPIQRIEITINDDMKIGDRYKIIKNDNKKKVWYMGEIGEIVAIKENYVTLRLRCKVEVITIREYIKKEND